MATTTHDHIELTSQIVAAYVSRNVIQPSDLPALISTIHQSLKTLSLPQEAAEDPIDVDLGLLPESEPERPSS